MYTILLLLHTLVCVLIVAAVLLQSSKGGGFAGIFGSSGDIIFSTPSGSSFLRRLTTGLAVAFGLTSLVLTIMTRSRMYHSVLQEQPAAAPQSPAPPAPAPPAPAAAQQTGK